jgi:hypothetical protein
MRANRQAEAARRSSVSRRRSEAHQMIDLGAMSIPERQRALFGAARAAMSHQP